MTLTNQIADSQANVDVVSGFGAGGTLLDLGANIGEVSIRCARQFDLVVAVEANPDTFEILAKRIGDAGLADRIEAINAVVAAESGLTYYVSDRGACAVESSAKRVKKYPNRRYYEVTTRSLASLLSDYEPRWIKMDIEGSEYESLISATFPESVEGVAVEFHGVNRPRNFETLRSIMERLPKQGLVPTARPPSVMPTTSSLITRVFKRSQLTQPASAPASI
jgi:FkbM family methyltransferase